MWKDIRDEAGRLLFRFDPARDLAEVEIIKTKQRVVVDLSSYRTPTETASTQGGTVVRDTIEPSK